MAVFTASAQYDFGRCFSFIIALATSSIRQFFRLAIVLDASNQILRYSWNMQDILDVGLIALFTERDIFDMPNGVDYVIPYFHIVESFRLSQVLKPFLVRRHMVRGI